MGLRGPGAGRMKAAALTVAAKPRRLPWKRKGLSRAERVLAFVQWLPITKGKLVGKKLKLLPNQRHFIETVYGSDKISIAVKSEPRGNGKTGLLAPLALCHLVGPEAEPRGEVYSAAIDRGMAAIMYAEMEAIIAAVPEFAGRTNCQRQAKKIEVLEGDGKGSTYEALSSDARRAHGLAPSLWVYDELAQAKDRELLDNLMTAMGKRTRSLGIVISTQAPTDEHPLSQLIDDGLSGIEPTTHVQLLTADEALDPFALSTLRSVNPALGIFLDEADLVVEANRARRLPSFEPAYRNLRLNQRVDANQDARIVPGSVWRLGDMPIDKERLAGRPCYGALDLSAKHDLTSLTLVFPDDEPEPNYDILQFFWTPLDQLESRRPAERDLFKQWIHGEHITGIAGPTIRYRVIALKLAELSREFDIQMIGYDRWRIDDLKAELAEVDAEIPLEPFGQGFKDMAPALEFFAELALTGRLRHGGHPVLTANVANAIVVHDPAGNGKFDKDKSNKRATVRIDGAVTLAMALGTARRFASQERPLDIADFISNAVMV